MTFRGYGDSALLSRRHLRDAAPARAPSRRRLCPETLLPAARFAPQGAQELSQQPECPEQLQIRLWRRDVPGLARIPCATHSHCYESREPSDWCVLGTEFSWTNRGCHCDMKLGSCIIERFNRRSHEMQWAFCTPKKEFYCESRQRPPTPKKH
uniref:Uncharacterized protein n=1 Tax=Steinernema glaseri TaxID=37863 RepID=A0A1I7ZTY0_9BILA